jgi:hypothetical protein
MCRDIVIHCKWGDDTAHEDVADAFVQSKDYDELTPSFKAELQELMDNWMLASIEIEVRPLS